MTIPNLLTDVLLHPLDWPTLVKFYFTWKKNSDISTPERQAATGWNRESMRRCWDFLAQNSESFAGITKQMNGEVPRMICLFYLVCRGLDTLEDDQAIPLDDKERLLPSFHQILVTPGWNYSGCGQHETAKELLANYDVVIEEIAQLCPEYRDIIVNSSQEIGVGMFEYAKRAATTGSVRISTIADYDMYCHYAAGLVGWGIACIFVASKREDPALVKDPNMVHSVGLFLQKVHIFRDVKEDVGERRCYWPQEILDRYNFDSMEELLASSADERATWVQSAIVLDALQHVPDILAGLKALRSPDIFRTSATVGTVAFASLELYFMNPIVFKKKDIRLSKRIVARLWMRASNAREAALIIDEYSEKIRAKVAKEDPNREELLAACDRIHHCCIVDYPEPDQARGVISFKHRLLAGSGGLSGSLKKSFMRYH